MTKINFYQYQAKVNCNKKTLVYSTMNYVYYLANVM